tara:strand:+ start:38 stop:301 length:264 start_codon:yes stop_codon:yes gene_type:complete
MLLSMKKILFVIFINSLIFSGASSEEMSINSLLKEGYKITKDEIIKRDDLSWATKVVTLKKTNEYVICTLMVGPGSSYHEKADCRKP